jgi:hypothetical protein
MPSLYPSFSHIYIEEEAIGKQLTLEILSHFPKAKQIIISNYRELAITKGK